MSEFGDLSKFSQYNARVNDAMLKMAHFIPLVMLGYGSLVQFRIIPGSTLYTWQALIALTLVLVIAGLTQSNKYGQSVLQQLSYYLILLSFAVFVIGLPAILIFWAPLSITTVLNFGIKGYWYSTILLLLFGLLNSAIQYPLRGFDYVLTNLALVVLVSISTGLIVAIISALMLDRTNLLRVKRKETLEYSRMQAIINSLSDAIVSVDNKGVIKIYNAAALSLVDTNKPLSGQKLSDVFHLHDLKAKNVDLFSEIAEQNKTIVREDLSHYFDNGETIRLSITGAPIYTSFTSAGRSRQGYIFIVRDITKVKSLEEERDEFISVISHELRTPITITEASISNMQLVAQRGSADHSIVKGLGEAHDQVVYLAKMINDLASLSRAERGNLPMKESISIKELMQSLYRQYATQARENHLVLDLDVAANAGSLTSNRLYIEEILQNLITNAIKYTERGSVTLHASRTGHGVLFAVTDTGSGIAKSEKEKVFEKFYRSEDYRTRETSGTGLGLYVAQKLASRLNAVIELKSRLRHGSTFSVEVADE